ncbi:MAG: 5'/3'-nucleotidase SurE [Muribaculaceae bacterium]|nr:5'/3'-nucleotidase SurE [Muribaculaceae bacterium]
MKKLILVSNDDGYMAKGVRELMAMLAPYGEVVAVCPDQGRSGQSMALTFDAPLRVKEEHSPVPGTKLFSCNGTPVDCVKISRYAVLGGRMPDLVVAGINHGSNASVNVLYSGTMGAVQESCSWGVPSVGFSLTTHDADADFSSVIPTVDALIPGILANGLPKGTFINVNAPAGFADAPAILCRESKAHWSEEYQEYHDPMGRAFFMLAGHLVNDEPESTDTDLYALDHGRTSVVLEALDRTASSSQVPVWLKSCLKN